MASRTLEAVLRHIRRLVVGPEAEALTDRQLLERFVKQRDQSAFAKLLSRHAPMVLGVCRGVLCDPNDVDDAFQATFLVLVRRAAAIPWRESLGGWLHGVARRTALNAKAAARRRTGIPSPEVIRPVDPMADVNRHELCQMLHEELRRLPAKYRDPVILCCLEGKTHEEAALELGWPKGSMAKRIATGQERLRARLAARGMAVSAALLAALMAEEAAAAVSPALFDNTLKAATLVVAGNTAAGAFSTSIATLAQGVIKTMWMTKVMKLTVVLFVVLGVAGLGGGLLFYRNRAVAVPLPEKEKQEEPLAKSKSDPTGVPLELRLVANKDSYTLDLGGRTEAEFREQVRALEKIYRPLPEIAVDLKLELRNTGDKPLSVTFADDEWRTIDMNLKLKGPGVFNIAPRVIEPDASRVLKPAALELAPGKSYSLPITSLGSSKDHIYPYVYWTQPGEYTLAVSWQTKVSPPPKGAAPAGPTAGFVTFTSNQVRLKVTEAEAQVK
jgi:RNA polymerase sigma factor (sigma-70 family)